MKNNRYLNLDVEILPNKYDALYDTVAERVYGVTFSQLNKLKTRVMVVQKDSSPMRYVQFYENDELKYEI